MIRSGRAVEKGSGEPGFTRPWGLKRALLCLSPTVHVLSTLFLPLTRHLSLSTGLSMEHAVLHINPEARGPPKQCCLLWFLPRLCLACHSFLRYQRDHVGPLHRGEAEVTPVRTESLRMTSSVGWLMRNPPWIRQVPFRVWGMGGDTLVKRHSGFSGYSKALVCTSVSLSIKFSN